ncbi:MAG: sigma 54-interacting transcriptional regulator [Clostridiales bacterium]|nr:sigma 54-interacting transcriptional regulator [Clostridiales bacterium]
MAKIDWLELVRPVAVLSAKPRGKKLPSEAWATVWPQGEKWLMQDKQGVVSEITLLTEDEAQDNIMPLIAGGGTALLFKDDKPYGLLNAQIAIMGLAEQKDIAQSFLSALMEISDEAVTIIDEHETVLGWNDKAQQLYKIKREEIQGHNIHDFFSSLVVTKQLHNAISAAGAVRDRYHQPMRGAHVMINAAPVFSGDKLLGAISSERDITQTMRLANELARSHVQVRDLQSEISKINRPSGAFNRIYGQSASLSSVLDIAKRIANTDVSILLRGESGTGKELFAEAIHKESRRGDRPFVVINCGAIPANLFESELFGYLPGSFTGADKKGRKGKFDEADHGTVFLDEIGELSPDMQVKLLRVLQNQQFTRVGGGEPVKVDVRLISATHRDLEAMIKEGGFREDLYYRVNVVSLEIPPLRERREDISQLTALFVREFCGRQGIAVKHIAPEVINYLLGYGWPGNIRELRNVVERMVVLSEGGHIAAEHLPPSLRYQREEPEALPAGGLNGLTAKMQRRAIEQALKKTQGSRGKAAVLLGISRGTLYYKIKKLGIG